MLRGYLPMRRAGLALLGCFVLFGASTIAQGLLGLTNGSSTSVPRVDLSEPPIANSAPPPNDNAGPYGDGLSHNHQQTNKSLIYLEICYKAAYNR
jgi:hypothetical protein